MPRLSPIAAVLVLAVVPPGMGLAATVGDAQSPIDIVTREAVRAELSPLAFDHAVSTEVTILNTGPPDIEATVRKSVPPGAGRLAIGRDVFDLLPFHFHAACEHLVDGRAAPMELHMVHHGADENLAVVARLIERGPTNEAFEPYFEAFPPVGADAVTLGGFDLSALVPDILTSQRYEGSLTTPPFTEGVRWSVLSEPLILSPEQIAEFTVLFPEGDAREVQPLGGRTVLTDVAPVPLPATLPALLAGLGLLAVARRRAVR